jgi:hypothetical protein
MSPKTIFCAMAFCLNLTACTEVTYSDHANSQSQYFWTDSAYWGDTVYGVPWGEWYMKTPEERRAIRETHRNRDPNDH